MMFYLMKKMDECFAICKASKAQIYNSHFVLSGKPKPGMFGILILCSIKEPGKEAEILTG